MSIMILEDPINGHKLAAEVYYGEGGGWKVSISPNNFLYTVLKDKPKAFVSMVFRTEVTAKTGLNVLINGIMSPTGESKKVYLKVVNGVHRWVKASKRGELPFLEYLVVKFNTLSDNMMVIAEAIEIHRQKLEGEYIEPSADKSN